MSKIHQSANHMLNIHQTKITWSALVVIVGLIGATYNTHYKVQENEARSKSNQAELNSRTELLPVIASHTTDIQSMKHELPKYRESNQELKEVLVRFTVVVERLEKDRDATGKSLAILSDKLTNVQLEVGQIKAKLN